MGIGRRVGNESGRGRCPGVAAERGTQDGADADRCCLGHVRSEDVCCNRRDRMGRALAFCPARGPVWAHLNSRTAVCSPYHNVPITTQHVGRCVEGRPTRILCSLP